MATIKEALTLAYDLLDARKPGEAEELLGRILDAVPDQADALHLLGVILAQSGRVKQAEARLAAAAAHRDIAEYHASHGLALALLGKVDEAIDAYRRALGRNPAHADAKRALGELLLDRGRRLCIAEDDLAAAADLREALDYAPDHAEIALWLGTALLESGRYDAAAAAYRRTLTLDPAAAAAWTNLAVSGRGDAITCCARAGAVNPASGEVRAAYSEALSQNGKPEEALREARKALQFLPDLPVLRMAYAMAALKLGRLAEGWRYFDARWRVGESKLKGGRPTLPMPTWDGGPVAGPLLVWAEQGLGDEIMYASLLPELTARGFDIVLWTDSRLHSLIARAQPTLKLSPRPDSDPRQEAAAAEIAMGDLPRLLRSELTDFPPERSPVLKADPAAVAAARARWDRGDGALLVGVSWRSANKRYGSLRSIDLAALAGALADVGSSRPVRLVSLQYGDVAADIESAKAAGFTVEADAAVDAGNDIDGLAALICALDVTVSIDNTTAHLAGALGAPVWTLLPFNADWRWMSARADSPWHPGMRLFRQPKADDWGAALAEATQALTAVAAGDLTALKPPPFAAVQPPDDAAARIAYERDKYQHMWRVDDYRVMSPGALQAAHFDLPALLRRREARTVLDAGCGSGKTSIHLMENGGGAYQVFGFDIADNCLDPYFRDFKQDYLTVGCLWRREDFRDVYDAVVCTDVLEHIPTDHVPDVLANLRAVCRKTAFFGIALFEDWFGPAELGEPLHLTVQSPDWWLARLGEAGFSIVSSVTAGGSDDKPSWLIVEAAPINR